MWQASAESREGSTEQQPGRRGHRVPAPPGLGVTGTETAVQARIQEEQGFTSQLLVLLRKPELPHRRRPKEEASHEGKHTDVADPPHKQKKKKTGASHTQNTFPSFTSWELLVLLEILLLLKLVFDIHKPQPAHLYLPLRPHHALTSELTLKTLLTSSRATGMKIRKAIKCSSNNKNKLGI